MGDRLRNAIGIPSGWTKEEKRKYKYLRKREITPVYIIEGLTKDSLADRARYWDKKLKLTSYGENKILKIAEEKGKAEALVALEKLALEEF